MRARAPGKVVLSGAYAVLFGAPAVVSAVDRFVLADTSRLPDRVTPEVLCAVELASSKLPRSAASSGSEVPEGGRTLDPPWFDASALRTGDVKLGLGSSAAILVASLAALAWLETPELDELPLRRRIFPLALAAHRKAQSGGSGVDVAASVFGGTLVYRLTAAEEPEAVELPPDLSIEVWSSGVPATTHALLRTLHAFGETEPRRLGELLSPQAKAARHAALAVRSGDAGALIASLVAQRRALGELGNALGVPIVTTSLAELAERAEGEGAALLPAGAGGGDVACYVGRAKSSPELRAEAERLGHTRLGVMLGARGVHRLDAD